MPLQADLHQLPRGDGVGGQERKETGPATGQERHREGRLTTFYDVRNRDEETNYEV